MATLPFTTEKVPALAEHGLNQVMAENLSRYDFLVVNERTAGNVLQLRSREEQRADSYHKWSYYELVPVDTLLLQAGLVADSMDAEADRIGGHHDSKGRRVPGELDGIYKARMFLSHWMTRSDEEEAEHKAFFGNMADVRARSVNPLNVAVAIRAARMRNLKDTKDRYNPQVMLYHTQPLEYDDEGRYARVVMKNMHYGRKRAELWRDLLHAENRNLATANFVMDKMLDGNKAYDPPVLEEAVKAIKFRVQPFNMIGHAIMQTRHRLEDLSVLERAQEGLQFHRSVNYLLTPFWLIGGANQDKLKKYRETDLLAIDERMESLESMGITDGPYHRVIGRMLGEAQDTSAALHNSDFTKARQASERFKTLGHYLCMPGDPDEEIFYRHKFSPWA